MSEHRTQKDKTGDQILNYRGRSKLEKFDFNLLICKAAIILHFSVFLIQLRAMRTDGSDISDLLPRIAESSSEMSDHAITVTGCVNFIPQMEKSFKMQQTLCPCMRVGKYQQLYQIFINGLII